MIKSNELRIGNLVSYDGRVFEIDSIAKEFPTLNTIEFGIGVVDWENIEPIPLTDEWLLKMGGNKVNNLDWCIMFGGIEFYCRYNKFWYSSIGSVYLSDKIQFVHQVQNLFVALTNQELEIKK
jgi:hypothetical protein